MSNGHICCLYGVCCPPEMMAAQIAGHFGIDIVTATKMANEIGMLIPRELPVSKADLLATDTATCRTKLARLQRHVKREMIDLLDTMGFPTAEED